MNVVVLWLDGQGEAGRASAESAESVWLPTIKPLRCFSVALLKNTLFL